MDILSYSAYAKWKLSVFIPICTRLIHSCLEERKNKSRRVVCCFSFIGPIDCEILSQRKEADPDTDISMQEDYGRTLLRTSEQEMERKQNWAKETAALQYRLIQGPSQPCEEFKHGNGPSHVDLQTDHYICAVTGRDLNLDKTAL